jgi:hypothetical protein
MQMPVEMGYQQRRGCSLFLQVPQAAAAVSSSMRREAVVVFHFSLLLLVASGIYVTGDVVRMAHISSFSAPSVAR